jgi:hypothetical protein
MAEAKMLSIVVAMGENSDDLDWLCYPWADLYVAEDFIWIGS